MLSCRVFSGSLEAFGQADSHGIVGPGFTLRIGQAKDQNAVDVVPGKPTFQGLGIEDSAVLPPGDHRPVCSGMAIADDGICTGKACNDGVHVLL